MKLDPVRRLADEEIRRWLAAAAYVRPLATFVSRDPYRPLERGARRVDYYEPSYVRGPRLSRPDSR